MTNNAKSPFCALVEILEGQEGVTLLKKQPFL